MSLQQDHHIHHDHPQSNHHLQLARTHRLVLIGFRDIARVLHFGKTVFTTSHHLFLYLEGKPLTK